MVFFGDEMRRNAYVKPLIWIPRGGDATTLPLWQARRKRLCRKNSAHLFPPPGFGRGTLLQKCDTVSIVSQLVGSVGFVFSHLNSRQIEAHASQCFQRGGPEAHPLQISRFLAVVDNIRRFDIELSPPFT